MDESVLRSINSQLVVRPRATVNGGTKQLKRLNRTKKSLRRGGEWKIAKTRGLVRVNQKLGPAGPKLQKIWKRMRASNRSKEEKNRLGDQIVKVLLEMACSNIEIQSFVNMGGPRLKKIRKSIK